MHLEMNYLLTFSMARDSSVGIATRYGLDGPGIESRWGRDSLAPSSRSLGPTRPLIQRLPGLSRGVKRPERGVDHPRPSSAEVKEIVELYLYSPLWTCVACSGVNSTFTVLTSRGVTLRNVLIRIRADHLTLPNHDLYSNGEHFPNGLRIGKVRTS